MLKQFCFLNQLLLTLRTFPSPMNSLGKKRYFGWHCFSLLCGPSTNPMYLSKQSILKSVAHHEVRHANSSPQSQCISPLCEQHLPPVPKRLQTAACEGLSPREHQKNFRLRIGVTSMWDPEHLSKGVILMQSLCSCLLSPQSPQIIPVSCEACILVLPFQSDFLQDKDLKLLPNWLLSNCHSLTSYHQAFSSSTTHVNRKRKQTSGQHFPSSP